jgi:DNA-binding CsgD family transcriptional regulator
VHSERMILDLVDHIYGAVESPALWPTFLEQFARSLQAQIGTLYIHDLRTQHGATEIVTGMDPAYDRAYRTYYAARNVYMTHGRPLLVAGNVMTSEELCPDEKVLPSEFYNEWVRPQGLRRGLNGVLFNQGSLAGSIGVIRDQRVRAFSADDKRFLSMLMPHLQRAVKLRSRIVDLETLGQRTSDALNRWATAVFLVDREARIVLANHSAAEILAGQDGLRSERGVLKTTHSRDTAILHQTIRYAVDRVSVAGDASGAMLLARISGKRPLHVFVSPTARKDVFFGEQSGALVFVADPEAHQTQSDVLQSLYGLTPAEAAVAALLAGGKSVKEIAETTSVRENTVRIHLKRIFDKTETKRQAELVRLLLSCVPVRRTEA